MKKFKVGDHLKAIRYLDSIVNKTLIDAEVTDEARPIDGSILSGKMRIKYIRFLNGDIKETGKSFWVDPQYFDYADGYSPVSGTVASFIINGQEYTNEQFVKDCERFVKASPNDTKIELSHAIEDVLIVYQFAQEHPFVSNIDHYAEELGWDEKQKESIRRLATPLPNFYSEPFDNVGKDWWDQEYKPKKGAKVNG